MFSKLDGKLNTVYWVDISPLSFNDDGYVGYYGHDAWLGDEVRGSDRVNVTKEMHIFYMGRYLRTPCEISLFTSATGGSKRRLLAASQGGF